MYQRIEGSATYAQNFNVENELSNVSSGGNTTSFSYDAASISVKTVEPGSKTTYYPFPGYEEEVNGSTTTRRITYAIAGQTVALRVQVVGTGGSNTLTYLHSDHLGSPSLATTTSGAVVGGSAARYLPLHCVQSRLFGGWRTTPTAVLTDIGYTGHWHNNLPGSDLELVYMNARFFVPSIGRFASADTLVPDPTNPQQYNRYSYVLNNPLRYSDPTGHSCYNPTSGSPCTLSDGTNNNISKPPTPIWTRSFIDNPDWVQYYGPTEWAEQAYSNGIHSGLDMGRYAQAFGSTGWNPLTEWYDFDGTYGTENRPLIPVYAGCHCTVDGILEDTGHYQPGRVNLRSTNETYKDWLLIYGHLMEITVSSGQSVTPNTIIGYLETSEIHVHVEIRKPDNSYINPFPYLSRDLQVEMLSFQGDSSGTRYRPGFSGDPYLQKSGHH